MAATLNEGTDGLVRLFARPTLRGACEASEGPPKTASSPSRAESSSASSNAVRRSIETRFEGGGAVPEEKASDGGETKGLSRLSEGAERGSEAGEANDWTGEPSPPVA